MKNYDILKLHYKTNKIVWEYNEHFIATAIIKTDLFRIRST